MIEKDSPIPLYIQFKAFLLEMIRNGTYKPSQKLPSMKEFCDKFDVSPITIRPALEELDQDGLIYRVPGKGYYISEERSHEFLPLSSFSAQMAGKNPSSQVVKNIVTWAGRGLARILDISINDKVALIERVRLVENEPWSLQRAYLSLDLCPDITNHDFEVSSLYDVLRDKYDLEPVEAEIEYVARLALPEEAEALLLPEPAAVLVMRQISFLKKRPSR